MNVEDKCYGSCEGLRCRKCQCDLVPHRASLLYMNNRFHATVPMCPKCGQIFLDEELVRGKIARVERELEDK